MALEYKRRALKKSAQGTFTADEWKAIVKRQRGRCASCGMKRKLTVDHIIPLSRGGTNFAFNLQGLCTSCNSKKSARLAAGDQHSLFDNR